MPPPVGQDWERLPPLTRSRQILADVFDIAQENADEYFVEAAGRKLRAEPWPIDALERAAKYTEEVDWVHGLFAANRDVRVPLWERLAEDLTTDPDFRDYVYCAARNWLRKHDEYTPRDVTISFAHEGHACTVEYAADWYAQRSNLTGKWRETWIKLLEATLGAKPVTRLVKIATGRRPSEGERRGKTVQQGHAGQAATDVTHGDDRAAVALLDRDEQDVMTPLEVCLEREEQERLRAAIAALPDELRQVLVLRFEGGLTHLEIGEALHWSADTSRRRYHQALDCLRRYLNPARMGSAEDRP